jgi:hypothetical protein
MREIDKLAEESWKSSDQWPNESDYAHIMGFQAGFRKAREMAVAESQQVDDVGMHCINLTTILEQLGESEVE